MDAVYAPTVGEAIEEAFRLIEQIGYRSGDMHDNLSLALSTIRTKAPAVYSAPIL